MPFSQTARIALLGAVLSFPALAQQAPLPAVIVAPAAMTDLRPSARFTGRVTAEQKVAIQARVEGIVQEIGFTEGATVEAGTVLYRIEPTDYEAAVQEIEGSIAAAEAERRLAEIERDRKAQLVSRNTVAQSELDIAVANLGKTEGEITRLRGTLARAELNLSYTTITAPFGGRTGLSAVDTGALVGPGSGALTTLTRLDPIAVTFPIATALLLQYRAHNPDAETGGDPDVRLTLPDGTDYPEVGRIDFVDAEVQQGTDTVTVRAVFENPDRLLFDGALVTVTLARAEAERVLTVPQQAVQRDLEGAFVFTVAEDGTASRRGVTVARSTRGRAVIEAGLEEGELVVTEGLNKVRPGARVDAALAGE